ncbi:MAG TPA: hypothetical protein VFI49_10770, partial [Rudaea sp.]|nr:hypothetical protein [Rudaea sp.]
LSVVNTHQEGKAVKVRFLEGYDSREVLDFNLYLSQYDVWVAQVYDNGTGGAVATNDNSCTVPAFTQSLAGGIKAQPFSNLGYSQGGYGSPQGTDNGPTNLDRTREGYVEMIEMGVVTNATKGSLTSLTHVAKVPASCAKLVAAWSPGGYWAANAAVDMTSPTGGLFGAGSIINVSEGTIAAYDADAIDGFSTTQLHTNPGSLSPNLASANFNGGGINPVGAVTSYVFNNGILVTSNYDPVKGIDAVSSVFAADHVYNEYVTDQLVGASSEWVVTFPTKRFYVDPAINKTDTAFPPFEQIFDATSCFGIGLAYYDREETQPVGSIGFSPPPITGGNYLCYEAQVITFNQDGVEPGVGSSILGSTLASNVDVYTSGWLDLSFPNSDEALRPSVEGNVFMGLPVTGFLVTNYVNAHAAPGILGNYSGLYRHRISRDVTSAD